MKIFLAIISTVISFWPNYSEAKSNYDQVMETRILRCGYGIFPPQFMIDPNTDNKSGIMVDIMRAIGEELDIKINFTEEVDWGQIPQALKFDKIDAFCAGMWGTAKRGANIGFTTPLFFSAIKAYARADDQRFDNDREAINKKDVILSVNDGDVTEEIADQFFPKSDRFYKTQMAAEEMLLLNVATNKADVTFTAPSIAEAFIRKNPGEIKEIPLPDPILVYKHVIGVDIKEHELRLMLNAAVEQLLNNGIIADILEKYEGEGGKYFYLPKKPY